ncbi:hypothetical protein CLV43_109396 [Umezawaea tangerina]|uniref:Uncharacterized protein n=1 Tax=Umezawaea tangerina TaxID=84725 RepID=A0A2T0SXN6_9PSEU|nr:hypothetical protein CLV43_109396 [Umezawaea tangerina]
MPPRPQRNPNPTQGSPDPEDPPIHKVPRGSDNSRPPAPPPAPPRPTTPTPTPPLANPRPLRRRPPRPLRRRHDLLRPPRDRRRLPPHPRRRRPHPFPLPPPLRRPHALLRHLGRPLGLRANSPDRLPHLHRRLPPLRRGEHLPPPADRPSPPRCRERLHHPAAARRPRLDNPEAPTGANAGCLRVHAGRGPDVGSARGRSGRRGLLALGLPGCRGGSGPARLRGPAEDHLDRPPRAPQRLASVGHPDRRHRLHRVGVPGWSVVPRGVPAGGRVRAERGAAGARADRVRHRGNPHRAAGRAGGGPVRGEAVRAARLGDRRRPAGRGRAAPVAVGRRTPVGGGRRGQPGDHRRRERAGAVGSGREPGWVGVGGAVAALPRRRALTGADRAPVPPRRGRGLPRPGRAARRRPPTGAAPPTRRRARTTRPGRRAARAARTARREPRR